MWILVIGAPQLVERPDGGAATLRDLGCRVRVADLWEPLEEEASFVHAPPAAVLVEALDRVEVGRAVLARLREVPALREVPCLLAITVGALQRLSAEDAFDDLVLVPYVPVELYVRIRRQEQRKSAFADDEQIKLGPLTLDLAAHEVRLDGERIDLTNQELALLSFLVRHPGRVFSRQQLLERVWGVDYYGGSRTVDIHVRRVRMKLGTLDPIETVRGVGYKARS
ncbi:MAG: response regulator transcription factor [Sandaracinaceae bacterium]|nr:response regulator transcription factor [Sandaracinaceae bacterium]